VPFGNTVDPSVGASGTVTYSGPVTAADFQTPWSQAYLSESSGCTTGNFAVSGWGTVTGCAVSTYSRNRAGAFFFTSGSTTSAYATVTLTFTTAANAAPFCTANVIENGPVLAGIPVVILPGASNVIFETPSAPPTGASIGVTWNCVAPY
jgi:hypothetical protein